ncbi:MAG: hypothetical protein J5I59_06995, partial [Saprospiraceae bacterium]|nr:hypothetical protein [Saprospiraceae bacterium]
MKTFFNIILICHFSALLFGQGKPFFLNLPNNDIGIEYYQTAYFCTEINDDEVVYLETYYLPKFPIVVLDYGSKIVKSNKNGTVIK